MRTTTIGALAEAFTTTIRQVTPAWAAYQDRGWRPVEDIPMVENGELRTFYVDMVDPVPVRDGIYSPSAIEHQCTALVYTNYSNLRRTEQRAMCGEDARQIWVTLDVLRDAETSSTIAGLVSVEHQGWQDEDDEQGRQWGAHVYTVRFIAEGIPGAS